MRNLAGVAAGRGRGARSAALFLGAAGLLTACGGGGGGPGGIEDAELIVVAITPTNGQETLSNLGDPGLDGKVTVTFTGVPTASSVMASTNGFNGLTPNVQILDQSFARVPGTPGVDKSNRTFTFAPDGGVLPPNQYTITLSKFVTSSGGKLLNNGIEDFSASWTVGPDVYPPVVRNTSPAQNQSEVPVFAPTVITFNESIDPATVVLGQTVFVEDGGVNPPVPVNGTLALKRDGFDLVFTPDPCSGLPPSTTIVVRLMGVGNVTFLRDRVGNGLVGDPNNANQLQFQYNTRGVKPLPIAANMWAPGAPLLVGNGPPQPYLVYVSTTDHTYAFDLSAVMLEYNTKLRLDTTLVQQVLDGARQPIPVPSIPPSWTYGNPYGGDFDTKLGRAGEAVVDFRFDTATGDTYIYQIDEANESVAIIHSATGKIEGRFKGIGTPKGLGLYPALSPSLFVSNFGQGTVTSIPIGSIQPGLPICTAVQELNDDATKRLFLQAGRNPAGVAADYLGTAIAGVVNQGDGEFQVFDPNTLQPINRAGLGQLSKVYGVGENPIDIAWSPYNSPPGWIWAFIVNQGGPQNPNGSVSVWWNASTTFSVFDSRSGSIISTISDTLAVPGRPTADPIRNRCFVPNTGSDEITEVEINIIGSYYFTTIIATVRGTRTVGENPTSIAWAGFIGQEIALVTLPGAGQVAAYPLASSAEVPALFNLPGARYAFSIWNE